jgi:hypothetical protein
MKKILIIFICIFNTYFLSAQVGRYQQTVFSNVKKTKNIPYCSNFTIEPTLLGKVHPEKVVLKCDFYEPTGDTQKARPLVIFLHSGRLWPSFLSGLPPYGYQTDSALVELSTRLAKMGYTCASAHFREGWSPTNSDQSLRDLTYINAVYRGVQDVRSCVRFFKKNSNQYRIDTSRIVIIGAGSGGSIALSAGSLDSYGKIFISTTPSNKFIFPSTPPLKMITPETNGNIDGTSVGIAPAKFYVPEGDTLNIPSNIGPSSKIQMTVNLGGSIPDLAWFDSKSTPNLSFQLPNDFSEPYLEGPMNFPATSTATLSVSNFMGSYKIQKKQDSLKMNESWKNLKLNDTYTKNSNKNNIGLEGLYPFVNLAANDNEPWTWFDIDYWIKTKPAYANSWLNITPNVSSKRGKSYCDTIIGYFAPRAYQTLELAKIIEHEVTFIVDMKNEVVDPNKGVSVIGTFQKGNPIPLPMTNKPGTTTWEYKTTALAGDYQFFFINGNNQSQSENLLGIPCSIGNLRVFKVTDKAITIGPVCFSKCFACDEFAVTLTVDMSKQKLIDPAGIYVAGGFQGWEPSITKMNQTGSLYRITVMMKEGKQEYKFINGNSWGKDENLPKGSPCIGTGGTNRVAFITKDEILECYHFGSCSISSNCKTSTNDQAFESSIKINPNPASSEFFIDFDLSKTSDLEVQIINNIGQIIQNRTIKNIISSKEIFNISEMTPGIYFIKITNGDKQAVKRIVVQK